MNQNISFARLNIYVPNALPATIQLVLNLEIASKFFIPKYLGQVTDDTTPNKPQQIPLPIIIKYTGKPELKNQSPTIAIKSPTNSTISKYFILIKSAKYPLEF